MIAARPRLPLTALVMVAMAAIVFEVSLTRYFAIASWAEYGYWVISIAMVGICASGVVLSLAPGWFAARAWNVAAWIPPSLIVSLALGFWATCLVPFNPYELQNPATNVAQFLNILRYFLVLFPFFFLAGLFVGLNFIAGEERMGKVYAADLVGAGIGSLVVLIAMESLHPFRLPLLVLLPLSAAALAFAGAGRARLAQVAAFVASLALALAILLGAARPQYNDYKQIAVALRVEGGRVVEEVRSSRGLFAVLDNFTERLDIDLSNNAATLAGGRPPAVLGLYAEGNRITSLPKPGSSDLRYVGAALDGFPYTIRREAKVALVGTRGGLREAEVRALGARDVLALEPDPTIAALVSRYGPAQAASAIRAEPRSPVHVLAKTPGSWDVIDLAQDFLAAADANRYAFTAEAFGVFLRALRPGGVLSVPVSIREFTVYAVKIVNTALRALKSAGVADPSRHVMVVRSAWNARVLVSPAPFAKADVEALDRWAAERSFDVSAAPGLDLDNREIWNDLPHVSFSRQIPPSTKAFDALAFELAPLLAGHHAPPDVFDVSAITDARPYVFSVLHPWRFAAVLSRLELVPREEIGLLINMAVLAQALMLATVVMLLPVVRRSSFAVGRAPVMRAIRYFFALGLGFLFIEIFLIELGTALLADRATAFALVISALLIFAGLGSAWSGRFAADPRRSFAVACSVIVGWSLASFLFADSLLAGVSLWNQPLRVLVLIVWTAPVGVALGFPFAVGLTCLRPYPALVPWAWSLNGAASVIATPLANLLAVTVGLPLLLLAGGALYMLTFASLPLPDGELAPSRLGERS